MHNKERKIKDVGISLITYAIDLSKISKWYKLIINSFLNDHWFRYQFKQKMLQLINLIMTTKSYSFLVDPHKTTSIIIY